jgi:hypothetical protein
LNACLSNPFTAATAFRLSRIAAAFGTTGPHQRAKRHEAAASRVLQMTKQESLAHFGGSPLPY